MNCAHAKADTEHFSVFCIRPQKHIEGLQKPGCIKVSLSDPASAVGCQRSTVAPL